MIKLENVSFKYKNNQKEVLNNISFTVNDGEIVAIVGKNGSGKSTIGRLIAGITKLKKGTIKIDDIDISNSKQVLDKVGIVFQNPENQIIFNSIYDELSFTLTNKTDDEKNDIIDNALKQVDMLEYKSQDLYSLSLGQKQRIIIAEMLARNPKYIILDEPTTMIDTQGKHKIYNIIKELKNNGYTIIIITNLADEILLADRTLILNEGNIVDDIPKKELLNKFNILEEYSIEQPTIIKIIMQLKKEGIDIDLDNFDVNELVQKLKEKIDEKHN